jgi:hypothetical protein
LKNKTWLVEGFISVSESEETNNKSILHGQMSYFPKLEKRYYWILIIALKKRNDASDNSVVWKLRWFGLSSNVFDLSFGLPCWFEFKN